jgi:hypothetical protein
MLHIHKAASLSISWKSIHASESKLFYCCIIGKAKASATDGGQVHQNSKVHLPIGHAEQGTRPYSDVISVTSFCG